MAFTITPPAPTVDSQGFVEFSIQHPADPGRLYLMANMENRQYLAWFMDDPTTWFYLGGSSVSWVGTTKTYRLRPQGGWPAASVSFSYAAYNADADEFLEGALGSVAVLSSISTPGPIQVGVGVGGIGFGLD